MSSYLSSLLTSSTEKYHTLRRTLASETDGDTDDDSHISRVLRQYYTESGRGLPSWLPPDPKRPAPATMTSSQPYGSSYGQPTQSNVYSGGGSSGGGRNTLADLWDSSPRQTPQQQAAPQSVRGYGRQGMTGSPAPQQHAPYPPRPVEGLQRQESSGSASGTAQERLKARLWGQPRGASPGPGSAGGAAPTGGRWA